MTRKSILAITLIFLFIPFASIAGDEPANTYQATARLLAGCRGTDWHDSTFAGRDSVSWAFNFYNPAGDDTLDLAPSAILITTTASVCSVWTYGAATAFIDEARPLLLYENETRVIPAQVEWIHLQIPEGGGQVRAEGYVD